MEKKEYLNEESYQKGKKKILKISLIILVIGILIGGSLIAVGLVKQHKINQDYSEEKRLEKVQKLETEKQNISNQIASEKINLEKAKTELENKIAPLEVEKGNLENEKRNEFLKNGFSAKYNELDMKIKNLDKTLAEYKKNLSVVQGVLEDSDFNCTFDGSSNSNTSKYCSLVVELNQKDLEIGATNSAFSAVAKKMASSKNTPFYIFGGFIIAASAMVSFAVYMFAKRREIMAFTVQQTMPVAQEGIEKMAPTIGNATGTIAHGITKGIKDALKDEEK